MAVGIGDFHPRTGAEGTDAEFTRQIGDIAPSLIVVQLVITGQIGGIGSQGHAAIGRGFGADTARNIGFYARRHIGNGASIQRGIGVVVIIGNIDF